MAKNADNQRTMTLKVEKFRAINSARLDLDGITIITGENGSGKSTLSKILYNTIKYSKKYELLIGKKLSSELKEIAYALTNSVQEIARYGNDAEAKFLYPSRNFRRLSLKSGDIEEIKEYERKLYSHLNIVENYIQPIIGDNQLEFEGFEDNSQRIEHSLRVSRIKYVLQDALSDGVKLNFVDFNEILRLLKTKISTAFEQAYGYYNARPIDLFSTELSSLFDQSVEGQFDLIEYGLPITDWKENKFNNTSWIKNSIYIDTPMAINEEGHLNIYWNDLNRELKSDKGHYKDSPDFNEIDGVISGNVYYDNDRLVEDGFKYKRADGSVFNIDDCATGIKAFGILQLLLNNGKLTKDTLLIIDEPEAHLHPQWIVEYAHIVVSLNKQIGVKFFIASHNPDMVSAIKYIAEKEKISDRVNFYLAEKVPDNYVYNYKSLKTNIEEIFSSFNIAIERINKYGGQDA